MRLASGESIRDFAYRWRLKISNLKHPMFEEDLISTFMRTLGPTYHLMLLTVSQNNFAEVVNKVGKVELTIRVGLVHEASLTPTNSSKTVPKKAAATRQKLILCIPLKFHGLVRIMVKFCHRHSHLKVTLQL